MKIRNGFVSNSSSSSFIIIGDKPKNILSCELNRFQIEKVIEYYNNDEWNKEKIEWNGEDCVYLTEYISDCIDFDEFNIDLGKKVYKYNQGGVGGFPYSDEFYDILFKCYNSEVYIMIEHNVDPNFPFKHRKDLSDHEREMSRDTLNSVLQGLEDAKNGKIKPYNYERFQSYIIKVNKLEDRCEKCNSCNDIVTFIRKYDPVSILYNSTDEICNGLSKEMSYLTQSEDCDEVRVKDIQKILNNIRDVDNDLILLELDITDSYLVELFIKSIENKNITIIMENVL